MSNKTVTVEELNESILQLLEDERKRISLDLHDGVQNKLRLLRDKYLKRYADSDFADDMKSIMDEVRHVAYQLIPKNLQKYPLVDYLSIYAATLNQTYATQFKIDFQTNVEIAVPKKIEVELFKMVQEAFNNMLKHAANSPVFCIRYLQREDQLVLILQDFGNGFDLEAALEKKTIGLNGIHTRAERINATVEIETGRFEGCKIKITLPIASIDMEGEIPESYETKPPQREKPSEIGRILIVDNQLEYCKFLQEEIKKTLGITAEYCLSASDARKYLKEKDYKIDVVITDITMPGESGIRMIKKIREEIRELKQDDAIHFMIYSINDNPAYVFQVCKMLNINSFIHKEDTSTETHQIITALQNLKELKESDAYETVKSLEEEISSKAFKKLKLSEQLQKRKDLDRKKNYIKDKSSCLSHRIQNLADCFDKDKKEPCNHEEDSLARKTFKAFRAVENNMYCETSTQASNPKGLIEQVKVILGEEETDNRAIYKRYERFLKKVRFNSKEEMHHLLLRVTDDLDLK
jgi:DNA-binding NarL/FixJ family response regulator/two-component sensor histidine kinase